MVEIILILSKMVGSTKGNIFELCPKERLDMMREVHECKLESSRDPLVRPLIRSVGRKIGKLGSSFEKFSPKASKQLPKKERESTRMMERRQSTLQPSSSRSSKLRMVFLLISWPLLANQWSFILKTYKRELNNESSNPKNGTVTLKPHARIRFDQPFAILIVYVSRINCRLEVPMTMPT